MFLTKIPNLRTLSNFTRILSVCPHHAKQFSTSDTEAYDVVISGGGMVGAAMAGALGKIFGRWKGTVLAQMTLGVVDCNYKSIYSLTLVIL